MCADALKVLFIPMDDRRPSKLPITTTHSDAQILHFSHFILPYLDPLSLASISSTCKTLNTLTKSISSARSSDASRAFEPHPIPFLNTLDSQPYSYFLYTPTQILPNPNARQAWGLLESCKIGHVEEEGDLVSGENGCDCKERCGEECDCGGLGFEEFGVVGECGKGCCCGNECGKRVSQRGISVRLRVVKDGRKGWGLCAAESIKCGQFVCEYAGELLTTKEAQRRQQIYDQQSNNGYSSALLVVREHLPSGKACLRINIDATRIGNVGRFINHSCDGGNLSTVIVRSSGNLLPRLCFFAATDIQEGNELSFSYGSTRLRSNGLPCFCGSLSCCGVLPSEVT